MICGDGESLAKKLLPARIHIDPEKNIDLAIDFIWLGGEQFAQWCPACITRGWLLNDRGTSSRIDFLCCSYTGDVGVIAQAIGALADDLLNPVDR